MQKNYKPLGKLIRLVRIIFNLIALVSLSFFLSCDDIFPKKAVFEIVVENVTDEAATIVASLVPNQPGTTISWRYKEEGSSYSVPQTLLTEFDGLDTIKVDWQLSDLKASTTYILEVVANNIAGSVVKEVFFTSGKPMAKIGLRKAEEVKLTSAKLTAWFVPNQPETEFTFEYKEVNSSWKAYTLPNKFSGTDSVKVSFDLLYLKKSTLYSFRVRAINSAGEKISNETTFKTYAAMDIDGNGYHEVTIGTQTWLQSNLKTTRYANGDLIPNVTDQDTWESLKTPAMCWYDNDPKYGETYGALYNWYVGADSRPLIEGWHVPNDEEFETLANHLGGHNVAGGKLKLTGTEYWVSPNTGATNESGFNAFPAGVRNDEGFQGLGYGSVFWTKKNFPVGGMGWSLLISRTSSYSSLAGDSFYKGESLRLIKN